MKPDYTRILTAVIRAMVDGRHSPHCYSAHVLGRGYVNDGSKVYDRADYLRQLEQSATSELESIGWALDYAEPGRETPAQGILFANWNVFPSNIDRTLEQAGYAIEWSDEWDTCEDCQRAFRTSADSFIWQPSGVYLESDGRYSDDAYHNDESWSVCLDCLEEWARNCRENELQDAYDRALPIL